MRIPTTLKHKPVIVSENYENIEDTGRTIQTQKACRLASRNGMIVARWRYPQRSGDIRERNGHGRAKNCHCTESLIWRFSFAGQSSILEKRTATISFMTRKIHSSIVSACRETQ